MTRTRTRSVAALVALGVLSMSSVSSAVAASPAGRIFTVAGTHDFDDPLRFGAPATRSGVVFPSTVLALPDNSFLLDDITHSRVLRVDPRGLLQPFIGHGREGDGGNEGPARDARMWSAGELVQRTDGAIVMIDAISGQLRVVTADGTIHKLLQFGAGIISHGLAALPDNAVAVADGGNRRVLRVGADGQTSVLWTAPGGEEANRPSAIAALPDGTLVIATYDPERLLARAPDGTVRVLSEHFVGGPQLVGEADGSVLAATGGADATLISPGHFLMPEQEVLRIAPDGSSTVIAGHTRVTEGFDGDGEGALANDFGAHDASRTSDGGLLIGGYTGVRYVAPENPALLAVAITRGTLLAGRQPTISFATTRPASVEITIRRRGSVEATTRVDVAAGDGAVHFDQPLRSGGHTVTVIAREPDGRVATDHQVIFIGGQLDGRWAVRAANQVIDELNSRLRGTQVGELSGCKRIAADRVDCPDESFGLCQDVIAVELHPDGLPYLHAYDGEFRKHCRFHPHPKWTSAAYPAQPL